MEMTLPITMVDDNRTESGPHVKPLVSIDVLDLFSIVNDFALCSFLSLFGVVSNTANIIVYSRIGFSESSNINFLALSVIDLLVSLVTFFLKMFYSPVFSNLRTGPTTSMVALTLSPAMMVTVCGSAMMTTLISTERCLCVVFPLKVKISRMRLSFTKISLEMSEKLKCTNFENSIILILKAYREEISKPGTSDFIIFFFYCCCCFFFFINSDITKYFKHYRIKSLSSMSRLYSDVSPLRFEKFKYEIC